MTSLPQSHPELSRLIQEEIQQAGGYITFARFMECALYAPEFGYYSSRKDKLGAAGDFVTAPEISALFAHCIARQAIEVMDALGEIDILEFGAGSGVFAKDLLLELEKSKKLPKNYFILEVSADLRARQQQLLETMCPHLLSRVVWLEQFPEKKIRGMIFANEVLDAMPVHRFTNSDEGLQECCVAWENNRFVWTLQAPALELQNYLQTLTVPTDYQSEASLIQPQWINNLASLIERGLILLLDYGYGRQEYYHPERRRGTLTCFYQHHHHDDPLILVGLQDISSHVDFTHLADAASEAGLTVAGFTTQAAFLLSLGLLENAAPTDEIEKYKQSQTIKLLTLPSEMGDIVKVMGLTKNLDIPLRGFSLLDRRRDLL